MLLKVHRFLPITNAEGPGKRTCILVQGCPIHCSGCAVPETWPFDEGKEISVEEIIDCILNIPQIEGVTFVGGEPFSQAKALAYIGQKIKDAGLSIVTFTGYILEEIVNAMRGDWNELLSVTDLLIDGPYRYDLADVSRPWVGSSNQRYHFLSTRYKYLEKELERIPNRLEIRLNSDGRIILNGMARADLLKNIFDQTFIRSNACPPS